MRQLTSWRLATQARLGQLSEARASLAALDAELAVSGEIGNARAAICLAEGNPAAALSTAQDVLNGIAPAIGYMTVVEANLLAALAHRELGDQRAATAAADCALALAEADRLVLPFAVTGSLELLKAISRHKTAHRALLTDILGVMGGSSVPGSGSFLGSAACTRDAAALGWPTARPLARHRQAASPAEAQLPELGDDRSPGCCLAMAEAIPAMKPMTPMISAIAWCR
jgi:hypothetical protein